MATMPSMDDAFLIIEGDRIKDYGDMVDCPINENSFTEVIDLAGRFLLPAWCDSHTHLVYAGSRETEYVDKIKGLSYAEIAAKGGGILNSASLLSQTSEEDLYESAMRRLVEISQLGTGAVEIKSGYGLTLDSELKMLRVIRRLKESSPLIIRSTFLAHAFPLEYRNDRATYVQKICDEFIPRISSERLADFVDVFCEEGFFTEAQTDKILEAGSKHGLIGKVHANQLHNSGGVQSAVRNQAISADHLEQIGQVEIDLLKNSNTIPTILPSAAFFLGLPFPPARKLIDEGLGIALATDYNPGSSPSGNMPLLMGMACIQMKILPQEAIAATTINGAAAMGVATDLGSIDKGKLANFIVTKPMPSLAYFTYSFGSNLIESVYLKGHRI